MREATQSAETTGRPGYLKGFWALMVTQFQGAFNDNALKLLILLFLPALFPPKAGIQSHITWITNALFLIPWLVLPGQAGAFSDRYSKRSVAIATKYWEVGVVALAVLAFYFREPYFIWFVLLLMSTQSTFFSPAKYGILPEMLPETRLSWGNGYLQMTTMVAIILGTLVGGVLLDLSGKYVYLAMTPLLLLSVIGAVSAHFITRVPRANPSQKIPLNPWSGVWTYLKIYASDRWLLLSLLGMVYFWFVGQLMQANIVEFSKGPLLGLTSDTARASLVGALAIGIGFGAVAAGYLSGGKIEGGLVPLGAFGLTLFLALLSLPGVTYVWCLVLLFGVGFSAGFYEIPLAAAIQDRSPEKMKGGMLAAMNLITFSGMLLATGLFALLFSVWSLSPRVIFLVGAVLTSIVGVVSVYFMPMYLVRLVLWFLTHTLYRLDVRGADKIPHKCGALMVANHTSFIDALAILAATDRSVRFLFSAELYDIWWIKPFAKAMRALPISTNAPPRQIIESLRQARQTIADGDIVCIFAEGQITRTGQLLPFKKGMEHIAHGIEAPIIPVYLDRFWGSIFSFAKQRFFWKLPRRIPYRLSVCFGEPMPANTPAPAVRQRIQALGSEAYMNRKLDTPLLHRRFIRMARRHPSRMAMADMRTDRMSYFKALIASIILARKKHRTPRGPAAVGILVPPSVGGAVANVAVQIMGKVAVILNYTASAESLK
ncbi:MAG: MFS transporter, partial [FCB group bacterium]|nr:MFS transporter [FCB group bacterium]